LIGGLGFVCNILQATVLDLLERIFDGFGLVLTVAVVCGDKLIALEFSQPNCPLNMSRARDGDNR
jgi:hypothetical protein